MDDLLAAYTDLSESSQIVIDSDSEQNTAADRASLSAQHCPVSENQSRKRFVLKQKYFSFFPLSARLLHKLNNIFLCHLIEIMNDASRTVQSGLIGERKRAR